MTEQMTNVTFVREIEKRPVLYNYDLPDYTRRDVTDAAWNEVGEIMGLSASACKDKWKNLRTVFVRHAKAACGGKRKKYYLNKSMKFILPYVKTLNSSLFLNKLSNSEHQDTSDGDSNELLGNSGEPNIELVEMLDPLSGGHPIKQEEDLVSEPENTRHGLHNNTSEIRHYEDRQPSNTRRMFLLSLMDEVGSMSDEQMRQFKRRVFALIDDIMDGNLPNDAKRPRNEFGT